MKKQNVNPRIKYLSKSLSTKIPKRTLGDHIEAQIIGFVEELACLYEREGGISHVTIKANRTQRQGIEITWNRFYEVKKK